MCLFSFYFFGSFFFSSRQASLANRRYNPKQGRIPLRGSSQPVVSGSLQFHVHPYILFYFSFIFESSTYHLRAIFEGISLLYALPMLRLRYALACPLLLPSYSLDLLVEPAHARNSESLLSNPLAYSQPYLHSQEFVDVNLQTSCDVHQILKVGLG